MLTRAEQLFNHGDNYTEIDQLEPFTAFASEERFSMDPERVLLILHNCYVMRTKNESDVNTADIVEGIKSLLANKKAKNANENIMARLEAASKTVAGEENVNLVGADRKVGFSLKEPEAEKPMVIASIEHEGPSFDEEPTAAELKRITKNHDNPE
jgi:hypothetical protein